MIKLSDFAKIQGVTPRGARKLLQTYEKELEGHFERQGQNGTWIDQYAQEFLRSKMIKNPVAIYDEKTLPFYDELQELRKENANLQMKLNSANEAFQTYVVSTSERLEQSEKQQKQLQAQIAEQKLLAAKATAAEEKAKNLEVELEKEKDVVIILSEKVDEVENALKAAEKEKKTLSDIADMNAQEAEREKEAKETAEKEAERAKEETEALRRELEKLKKRNLWERIFNK